MGIKLLKKALKDEFESGQSDDGYYAMKSEYKEDKRLIGRLVRMIRRGKR